MSRNAGLGYRHLDELGLPPCLGLQGEYVLGWHHSCHQGAYAVASYHGPPLPQPLCPEIGPHAPTRLKRTDQSKHFFFFFVRKYIHFVAEKDKVLFTLGVKNYPWVQPPFKYVAVCNICVLKCSPQKRCFLYCQFQFVS